MQISEEDLFTYFLQKNLWVKMYFEEFIVIMKKQGVEIIWRQKSKYKTK